MRNKWSCLKLRKETAALRLAVSLIEEENPVIIEGAAGASTRDASLQFREN